MHKKLSVNHPYGYLITQTIPLFGFIRISKNASTYIGSLKMLKLDKWLKINEFDKDIYCLIRDPVDRLVSGMIETFSRYRRPDPTVDEHTIKHRNVLVSSSIAYSLDNLDLSNLYKFIDCFLSLIEYENFDAHCDLQSNFINGFWGAPETTKFYIYKLSNIDSMLENIKTKYGLSEKSDEKPKLFSKIYNSLIPKFNKNIPKYDLYNDPIVKYKKLNNLQSYEESKTFLKMALKNTIIENNDLQKRIYSIFKEDYWYFENAI